eukprot:scaffold114_cov361-Pinguiococcus_pyrenoidosus.AAC.34
MRWSDLLGCPSQGGPYLRLEQLETLGRACRAASVRAVKGSSGRAASRAARPPPPVAEERPPASGKAQREPDPDDFRGSEQLRPFLPHVRVSARRRRAVYSAAWGAA